MTDFRMLVLYIEDPQKSARFYSEILSEPTQEMENFSMVRLREGVMLGLWSKNQVQPKPDSSGGGTEICFNVANEDALNSLHENWKKLGMPIAQAPTQMDFGITFVATDPDGHRLRAVLANPA